MSPASAWDGFLLPVLSYSRSPPVSHRLAMISSLWGFSAAQAREYAEALASEDMRELRRLLRHNRTFIAHTRLEFSRAVDAAFRPAPVPTIDVY